MAGPLLLARLVALIKIGPITTVHLLDAPSPLQAGDKLLMVEGRHHERLLADAKYVTGEARYLEWRAGNVVQYTVERHGQPVTLDVQLSHWTLATSARLIVRQGELLCRGPLAAIGWVVFLRRPRDVAARALDATRCLPGIGPDQRGGD